MTDLGMAWGAWRFNPYHRGTGQGGGEFATSGNAGAYRLRSASQPRSPSSGVGHSRCVRR